MKAFKAALSVTSTRGRLLRNSSNFLLTRGQQRPRYAEYPSTTTAAGAPSLATLAGAPVAAEVQAAMSKGELESPLNTPPHSLSPPDRPQSRSLPLALSALSALSAETETEAEIGSLDSVTETSPPGCGGVRARARHGRGRGEREALAELRKDSISAYAVGGSRRRIARGPRRTSIA